MVLDNIKKVYRGNGVAVEALCGISMEVMEGEFLLVVGPSGSGKSTLLNLMGLLDTPTEGRIEIDGVEVASISEKERTNIRNRKIGFVFQFFNLIPELTVGENVMLPRLIGGVNAREARTETSELLTLVGLQDKINSGATQLSGGQMQRVSIARALINQPSIVLADEPTGNLDSKTASEIIDLMLELNKRNKQTFIIVSHDQALAKRVDRLVRIRDGLLEN